VPATPRIAKLFFPSRIGPLCQRIALPQRLDLFITAVLILTGLYAVLQLTPSSYALVLKSIGISDTGLLVGSAHQIRSDEFLIFTPYTQMAVNNGFARLNALSLYGEDLRNFNALPLADWGLIFKPQMWAFWLLPPAAAYSLMFAILLATCLVGWYLFGAELGFPKPSAAVFSLTIFALPYVQLWWTTTGPLVACLPWLLLAVVRPMPPGVRIPVVAWMTATFLLSHFYVPFIASLLFAAGIIVIAFRGHDLTVSRLAPIIIGGVIGATFVALYLGEPIQIMAATVYPGHRTGVTGGQVTGSFVLAHLFPQFNSAKWTGFFINDLESGTGGSYTLLFAAIFLDCGRLREVVEARTSEDQATRWTLIVLGMGLIPIIAWWLLPLPSWLGVPLMWNAMANQRLTFAAGLLAHVAVFVLILRVGVVASLPRVTFAMAAIVGFAAVSKFGLFDPPTPFRAIKYDLLVVPLLLVAYAARSPSKWGPGLLLSGALSNALVFVPFNPLQKAGPIFAQHDTPLLRILQTKQAAHPKHWLVDQRLTGAIAPGLGFRSVQHTLLAPQLAFFRERFPDIPPDPFNTIFNRTAHIVLDETIATPSLLQTDVVRVPIAPFQ
jgi:hypothetical protein